MMLRAVVISPDPQLREGLERRIAESGQLLLLKTFDHYLSIEELEGFYRAHSPQAVFVDVSTEPSRLSFLAQASKLLGLQAVALHANAEPQLLLRLMNAGVRELLHFPFEREPYLETIARIREALKDAPVQRTTTDLVFAFLPGKCGSGSSILAANLAHTMTRILGGKVLLADMDINAGLSRFLLKLSGPFSVQDALERAGDLDDGFWTELVCRSGELDVLASGPMHKPFHCEQGAVRRLVEFASRRYKALCFDLSGAHESFTLELLGESKRIVLVIQPDLPTVYLAREKLRFLKSAELEDRVSVVLNRWHRQACLTIADIESALGLPVESTVPDSPDVIYRSMLEASPIEPASELGRELATLAKRIAETDSDPRQLTPKRRMVEYFSVLPARYSLFR